MKDSPTLCPSSRCDDGAILLGIVQPDGKVGFMPNRIEIDVNFVDIAHEGRAPEKRFRFASPCAKTGCKQWTGERCSVIDTVMEHTPEDTVEQSLPNCSIRSECRWYAQNGEKSCYVCPYVITDGRVDIDPELTHVAL